MSLTRPSSIVLLQRPDSTLQVPVREPSMRNRMFEIVIERRSTSTATVAFDVPPVAFVTIV